MLVFLLIHGPTLAEGLAAGLVRQGAQVAVLSDNVRETAHARFIATGFGSQGDIERSLAAAIAEMGAPDLILHASAPEAALHSQALTAMTDAAWEDQAMGALKATFYSLRACFAQLGARGCRIVLAGPALSLTGAEGLVPLAAAAEGQRALAKVAARQWGRHGFIINWLALGSAVFAPVLAQAKLPRPSSAEPPALGAAPALEAVAPLLLALAGDAGAVLTGGLLCLDGGEVMTP